MTAVDILNPTELDVSLAHHYADPHGPTVVVAAVPVAYVVPGDGLVARGNAYVVEDFPDVLGGLGMIVVAARPIDGGSVRDLEFTTARRILAWRHRSINHGLRRCNGCRGNVGRDHVTDSHECREDRHERDIAQSDEG